MISLSFCSAVVFQGLLIGAVILLSAKVHIGFRRGVRELFQVKAPGRTSRTAGLSVFVAMAGLLFLIYETSHW